MLSFFFFYLEWRLLPGAGSRSPARRGAWGERGSPSCSEGTLPAHCGKNAVFPCAWARTSAPTAVREFPFSKETLSPLPPVLPFLR